MKILNKLESLYGKKAEKTYEEINKVLQKYHLQKFTYSLSQQDSVLITYGDFIRNDEEALQSLSLFANKYLKDIINTIHILPFFPYRSDRGFSILDYKKVDPSMGSWQDITELRKDFRLMFDLVLNHVSDRSEWFQEFIKGNPEYKDFFIAFDNPPEKDLIKKTVRPRSADLIVKYETHNSTKYLWRTFLNDQIDLNYKNPAVLVKVIDTLMFYVSKGASLIRLDAVAFLWKELGTKSIHLPQTHLVIQLLRDILEQVAPQVLLVTETHVPHKENISYFGNGFNEAQIVYNFALPPLVLYSFITGDASRLSNWAKSMLRISDSTTYFNFLDSHDGIGLRAVEEVLSEEEINLLIKRTIRNKGVINYRNMGNFEKPYELNITWWSFLYGDKDEDTLIDQYIASRAIALSIFGIPGIYLHGLFGTENDLEAINKTKHNRDINRKSIKLDVLEAQLKQVNSKTSRIFNRYLDLIKIRSQHKAFHPNAEQKVLFLNKSVFSVLRGGQILALVNVSDKEQEVNLGRFNYDIITKRTISKLAPFQVAWLTIK